MGRWSLIFRPVRQGLNAQPAQFHIHVRMLDVLIGNSTFLQKNYVFFAPEVLDTIPGESSVSDGWKLFKHPSSVFTEVVTTGFFICFSPVSYTWNTLGIDHHKANSAAGTRSWKVLLVLRCTADVTGAGELRSLKAQQAEQEPGIAARISCLSARLTRLCCPSSCSQPCLQLLWEGNRWNPAGSGGGCLTQLRLCMSWGRGKCTQGPDEGLGEEFPVVRPGLGAPLLLTSTQHNHQ